MHAAHLAHAADPTQGAAGFLPFIVVLLVSAAVVVAAEVLLRGPLGEGNGRRFTTLAVLLALGAFVVVAATHLLPA